MKKIILTILIVLLLLNTVSCAKPGETLESSRDETSTSQEESSTAEETTQAESTTEARKTKTLRIGTFNIANGRQVNHDMKKIADDILAVDLDIVGLQEVDRFASRSKFIDTLKLLSEYTGYKYYYYTKAIKLSGDPATYGQDGEYGTGILSKYPIIETKSTKLESGDKEQRMLGYAKIDVDGYIINFYNTHLSHDSKAIRLTQIDILENTLKNEEYCFLTGDFNVEELSEYIMIPSLNTTCNESNALPTFASSKKTIDNILFSDEFTLVTSKVRINNHSDHYMLYADFTFEID